MDRTTFDTSLMNDEPPVSISAYLLALWYDAKGNWERSHEIIQDINDERAALIHAYLHRKEGDQWNADYWYQRAKAVRPHLSLSGEWDQLVDGFL